MTHHDIIVSIYSATRPGATAHAPMDCASFAGVSHVSSRPEGTDICDRAEEPGWTIDRESSTRKWVKIELPDGVSDGAYQIAGVNINGLHADHAARDGMGQTVYAYCNHSVQVDGDEQSAIDAAIASGILLSVPQPDGSRAEIPAKVIAVSSLFTHSSPADWK